MSRKLSHVSTSELEEAETKLRELYDHFCAQQGQSYISRTSLRSFAEESNLLDKKLSMADVDLIFDKVVVGKKPGLKFPRFMEACRKVAVQKDITYQSLVLMSFRAVLGNGADDSAFWVTCVDPESGEEYWWNTKTDATSWEEPERPVAADGAGKAKSGKRFSTVRSPRKSVLVGAAAAASENKQIEASIIEENSAEQEVKEAKEENSAAQEVTAEQQVKGPIAAPVSTPASPPVPAKSEDRSRTTSWATPETSASGWSFKKEASTSQKIQAEMKKKEEEEKVAFEKLSWKEKNKLLAEANKDQDASATPTKKWDVAWKEDKLFRGDWNATVSRPAFNAFGFLPVAVAQKPRRRAEDQPEEQEPPPPEPDVNREPLTDLPYDLDRKDVLMKILDRYSNYRGYISSEGDCINNLGDCIGYINLVSEQAGSSDEEYLGCVHDTAARNYIEVLDASDTRCGTLDLGTCYLKDAYDVTVGEVKATGVVTGHAGSYLGEFETFEYKYLRVLALYLMLVDPGMLTEGHSNYAPAERMEPTEGGGDQEAGAEGEAGEASSAEAEAAQAE